MIIKKVTNGIVEQLFDSNTKKCISQKFIASDQSEYYDDSDNKIFKGIDDLYHPFEMIQSMNMSENEDIILFINNFKINFNNSDNTELNICMTLFDYIKDNIHLDKDIEYKFVQKYNSVVKELYNRKMIKELKLLTLDDCEY